VALMFAAAFIVMGSVFSPERLRAGGERQSGPPPWRSTDPHAGLRSLGAIESAGVRVEIYATTSGPRFTVYDGRSGKALGTLLSLEQVDQAFPELMLPAKVNGSSLLMLVDPGREL
jgi:hypothetical protein